MKQVLNLLSISCFLGLLSFQAVAADDRTLASGQQRDCSQTTSAKQKARCEEVNKAMAVCAGKNENDLTNCLKEQRAAQRKNN